MLRCLSSGERSSYEAPEPRDPAKPPLHQTNEERHALRHDGRRCKHGNTWSIGNAARFYIAPIPHHTDFPGELFLLRQISYETNNVPSQVLANISL